MPSDDRIKQYSEAGEEFFEAARSRAVEFFKELGRVGQSSSDSAQNRVDDLVDAGRRSTEALLDVIRREISSQLGQLGLATKADLADLESRLGGRPSQPAKAPASGAPVAKAPAAKAAKAAKGPVGKGRPAKVPSTPVPPTAANATKASPTPASPTKASPTPAGPTKASPTKAAPPKAAATKASPQKVAKATKAPAKKTSGS